MNYSDDDSFDDLKDDTTNDTTNNDDDDDEELIDCDISDEKLLSLGVNKQLKKSGLTKAQATKMKQRRRTLKNRVYAASCRNKRLEVKDTLEEERVDVVGNIKKLKSNNSVIKQELVDLKDQYEQLKAFAYENNITLPKEFKEFVNF